MFALAFKMPVSGLIFLCASFQKESNPAHNHRTLTPSTNNQSPSSSPPLTLLQLSNFPIKTKHKSAPVSSKAFASRYLTCPLELFERQLEKLESIQVFWVMRSSKKLSEAIGKWRKRRKGYFVVYAKEGKRFVVPLYYLNHPIFRVLLEMAEEEFGLTVRGPLQVPCEEELLDHIVSLLRKKPHVGVERTLVSISTCRVASVFSSMSILQFHNQGGKGNMFF